MTTAIYRGVAYDTNNPPNTVGGNTEFTYRGISYTKNELERVRRQLVKQQHQKAAAMANARA